MAAISQNKTSIITAYTLVYFVWGSTYFFIQHAIHYVPISLLGGFRFFIAGILLLLWMKMKGKQVFNKSQIIHNVISGIFLSFLANGAVMVSEQYLDSSFVAIIAACSPMIFVLLDQKMWPSNFKNRYILLGLLIGFIGVILLFYDKIGGMVHTGNNYYLGIIFVLIGNICWVFGSLFSKRKTFSSVYVSAGWQMLGASACFWVLAIIQKDWRGVMLHTIPLSAWGVLLYLLVMGSLAGYVAYIWLLNNRPVTEVSTYAYVNPLVAVFLGYFFGNEHITPWQIGGLAFILTSIYFINYKAKKIAISLRANR